MRFGESKKERVELRKSCSKSSSRVTRVAQNLKRKVWVFPGSKLDQKSLSINFLGVFISEFFCSRLHVFSVHEHLIFC
jgi:hypothetical protein